MSESRPECGGGPEKENASVFRRGRESQRQNSPFYGVEISPVNTTRMPEIFGLGIGLYILKSLIFFQGMPPFDGGVSHARAGLVIAFSLATHIGFPVELLGLVMACLGRAWGAILMLVKVGAVAAMGAMFLLSSEVYINGIGITATVASCACLACFLSPPAWRYYRGRAHPRKGNGGTDESQQQKPKISAPEATRRRIGLLLFVLLFFTYAYFRQSYTNPNPVTRLGMAISILTEGTLIIDKFHTATIDKAFIHGHYYCDKAPGLTFMSLPFAAAALAILRTHGGEPIWVEHDCTTPAFGFVAHVSTVFTSGLMTALAGTALFFMGLRLGASVSGAIFATLSFGLATPVWGWATAFLGHAPAGACLFLGFTAVFILCRGEMNPWKECALGFLAGMLLSWAVVVEYPAAVVAAVIAFFGIISAWRREKRRLARVLFAAGIGGVIFALPLLIYNKVAFGSPFTIGYHREEGFEGMREGFLGITYPKLAVLYQILIGPHRGILWIAPILLAVPFALHRLVKMGGERGVVAVVSFTAIYYLLLNASYHYWDGGGSTGPRHLTPLLPFVCLPLGYLWTTSSPRVKSVLLALLTVSMGISLVCVSMDMFRGQPLLESLRGWLIPFFLRGSLKTVVPTWPGWDGHVTLVPLFGVWGCGALYMRHLLKEYDRGMALERSVAG